MVKDTGPACVSAFEPSPNPLANEKEQENIGFSYDRSGNIYDIVDGWCDDILEWD